MILGIFEKDPARKADAARIEDTLRAIAPVEHALDVRSAGPLAVGCLLPGAADGAAFDIVQEGELLAAVAGRLYTTDGQGAGEVAAGRRALAAYRDHGDDFGAQLLGRFACLVFDAGAHRMLLCRDQLGIEPVFYAAGPDRVVFGSTLQPVARCAGLPPELDPAAVARFLMFNYNPGLGALFRGVRKLRAGHCLTATRTAVDVRRYWSLSFRETLDGDEGTIAEGLIERVRLAVRRRMPATGAPAVFVSGGLDSSTVLSLVRELYAGPLHTYSYRCKSESFDESRYARRMAESVSSEHTEVEYRAADALRVAELTRAMSEPFCDVGINVATYLLARQARGVESLVFTGDGGDELFGGHPIYEADKIARFVDPIPGPVRAPLLALMATLPDSDQKKNLTVKLKRFGESARFSPRLLSHRWRVYYQLSELRALAAPALHAGLEEDALFGDVLAFNEEAAGPDPLSRSLYSDYQTIVDFYLRRNDLFRDFGIETRYPLFDRDLVEYCAAIPSNLKVKGWFETKYIFKRAIEGVVPHDIVHRTDKLGHSIPLKNWLRDDPAVRELVLDHVSEGTVRNRGFVRPEYVAGLIDDHMRMRRNNSHRLWTLAVFEMWCRHHVDGGGA